MKTYAGCKQRAILRVGVLAAALAPAGMLAGTESSLAKIPGRVEQQQTETAAQLVDRLLSLPNYVPNFRAGGEDQRTPLLRAIAARGEEGAAAMVSRLMTMPSSKEDPQGTRSAMRWQLIRDIGSLGDVAIKPVQAALGTAKTADQQWDLVKVLGAVQTMASTRALLPLLADKDDAICDAAISSLTDRLGAPPDQGGSDDVLPALAKVAPEVRTVLYRCLICSAARRVLKPVPPAEKPDERQVTLATELLRERLKNDTSEDVRFTAACALTEFGDKSGLQELEKVALAMQAGSSNFGLFTLDQLVPALERATGQKFGPLPMNPTLSSNANAVQSLQAQRQALLDKIAAWIKANPVK